MIIVISSFSKTELQFENFSVHTKTQGLRFQIPPVWGSSVWITEIAALWNISCVVWTVPKHVCRDMTMMMVAHYSLPLSHLTMTYLLIVSLNQLRKTWMKKKLREVYVRESKECFLYMNFKLIKGACAQEWKYRLCYCKIVLCWYVDSLVCRLRSYVKKLIFKEFVR